MFHSARTSSPVATSSTTDAITSAIDERAAQSLLSSADRARAFAQPPHVPASAPVRSIGASPNASAVTSVSAAANASTRRSTAGVTDVGRSAGTIRQIIGTSSRRQQHAERAAEHGEDDAFGGELPDQPLASRADRGPHRQLLPAVQRAREQEVGQVGADDQQHAEGRPAQRQHRDARVLGEVDAEVVHRRRRCSRSPSDTAGGSAPRARPSRRVRSSSVAPGLSLATA